MCKVPFSCRRYQISLPAEQDVCIMISRLLCGRAQMRLAAGGQAGVEFLRVKEDLK